MIKSVLLCTLLLLCTMTMFAQTSEAKTFEAKNEVLNKKMSEAVKQGDYRKAEQCCLGMLNDLEALPVEIYRKYSWIESNIYYNLACYQSLQNKKKEAVKNFETAYKAGYNDYRHILVDTDLNNIRQEKRFKELLADMKEVTDYLYILQKAPEYAHNERQDTLSRFTYMNPNDSNLVCVRRYFNLDSVAGAGDEISKIKNLLTFVHDKIRHDGQHENPPTMNAIALAEACKNGSRGLNCRGLATVLNECYLAMGFKSRFVTCFPKKYINDCHVINVVYSNTLDKWIWVDPTNNAWVMDENGTLLSIQEVRERLRTGLPIVLNEEANWNNKEKQTKEEYLENYMAKNLYCIVVPNGSAYSAESLYKGKKDSQQYVMLCPAGFIPDYPKSMLKSAIVYDAEWFWQSPYQE